MSTLPTQILLVSQYDAARLLGVERTTIWRMCGRGDLARVRIGRRTLITMDSIKAFIALQVECGAGDDASGRSYGSPTYIGTPSRDI